MTTPFRHSNSPSTNQHDTGTASDGSIALILSRNSMRNATLDCDSASIHYRIETPTEGIKFSRTTKLYRWDKTTNGEVLVAEWERNILRDRMRFLRRSDIPQDFVFVKDIVKRSYGLSYIRKHTFTGENGGKYAWKTRRSLKLYHDEEDNTSTPIAVFHRPNYVMNKHNAYLELQPEALEILDTLILTFLYLEKKRRDNRKAAAASHGGG